MVNLPSAVLRWDRMRRRLEDLEIKAVRLDGVDVSEGLEEAKKELAAFFFFFF